MLGVSCGGLTIGRVCVNVGPTDTGLNLGAGSREAMFVTGGRAIGVLSWTIGTGLSG